MCVLRISSRRPGGKIAFHISFFGLHFVRTQLFFYEFPDIHISSIVYVQEQSDWFIKLETELFRMRFQLEPVISIMQFLRVNNIILEQLGQAEKKIIAQDLSQSHAMTLDTVMQTDFFKVYCCNAMFSFFLVPIMPNLGQLRRSVRVVL